ncbi:MAG: phosphopantothenoylcysteine decarboxylase, partial [Gammaproteobacteria bacterium]|nr:phosphopantothenoylcysteine decarboxylase [Gammaproteobacteria bacterium]
AARDMGARVTLISGPVTLQPPTGIETVNVISADEMHTAVMSRIEDCDVFIAVAAVADYKPVRRADQKIKKSDDETLALSLVKNPDILAAAAAMEDGPFTVGFAAETEQLLQHARRKLQRKGVDMIVANDVSDRAIGFHSEENKVLVLERDSDTVLELDKMSKSNLSRVLLQIISKKLVKNTHR